MRHRSKAKWAAKTKIGPGSAVLAISGLVLAALCTAPHGRAQMTTVQAGAAAAAQGTSSAAAQNDSAQGTPPAFEVASIKKHVDDASGRSFIMLSCGRDPSRCTPTNVTAKMLIVLAYGVKDFQILGAPSWLNAERFDVEAKVDDAEAEQLQKLSPAERQNQTRLMLQSLLADRFKLSVTHGNKEVAALALVPAKGGPKVTAVPAPPPQSGPPSGPPSVPGAPGRGGAPPTPPVGGFMMSMGANGKANVSGKAVPITVLVNLLSQQLSKPVIDQTGLTGTYDITLEFTSDTGLGGMPLPPGGGDAQTDAGGESIFTALQDQLGLKLDQTKTPVDTITIEHIEEPSEN